jgi:peptidyl-dipeptidase A
MKLHPAPILALALSLTFFVVGCKSNQSDDAKLHDFIEHHLKIVEPLMKAQSLAEWNANATGEKKYYDEAAAMDFEIRMVRSNRDEFMFLKELKEKRSIRDSLLQRELILLFNNYVKNQLDTILLRSITDKQAAIALKFNTFRGTIDGKQVNDNEIRQMLGNERDQIKRKRAWEASKQVAKDVAPLLVELAKLRNEAAKKIGFENFYVMMLAADEQDAAEVVNVFDELKTLTDEPYRQMKEALDAHLAKKFGITPAGLRPWHYEDPFFQEAPVVSGIDFDKFVRGKNVVEFARRFYSGINLPVDDVLKNSDLYPRAGKYQHAYAVDVDRIGDIRTMVNVVDDMYWMGTVLHELGHCVYSKGFDSKLPFLLKIESHTFLTEGIAMLMERQAKNADWLKEMTGLSEKEAESIRKEVADDLRRQSLIFSRWAQVMMRFEKGLYSNPDQDLDKLWWDLVEQFQHVKRPEGRKEPDWAAKIHLAQYPCYYHNYMLGNLAASQFLGALNRVVLKRNVTAEFSFSGKPDVGMYLEEKIFRPGARLQWNDLLKHATGEGLTAKYFAEQFCGKE